MRYTSRKFRNLRDKYLILIAPIDDDFVLMYQSSPWRCSFALLTIIVARYLGKVKNDLPTFQEKE
jgi:hypothetical protein